MNPRTWILLGSVSAGIAVAMGALAAHGLETWFAEHFPEDAVKRLENWKTGANYQMTHSLGLILTGLVAGLTTRQRASCFAGSMMLLGIGLFSGMLYAWALTDVRGFVMLVPLGGVSFILGWVGLAWSSLGLGPVERYAGPEKSSR